MKGAASSAPVVPASAVPPARDLGRDIEHLKAEQSAARVARRRSTTDLKNLERRKRRVKQQALQLMNHDLFQVLMVRQAAAKSTAGRTPEAEDPTAEEGSPVATLFPE